MPTILQQVSKRVLGQHSQVKPWPSNKMRRHMASRILIYRGYARVLIVVLATVSALCGLIAPYCQKVFLDTMLGHAALANPGASPDSSTINQHLMMAIVMAFVGMILAQGTGIVLRIFCAREGVILNGQLARDVYLHAIRLTGEARTTKSVGEMVAIFTQDVSATVGLVEEFIPSVLSSFLPFIIAPIAVSYYFKMPVGEILFVQIASATFLMFLSYRQSFFFSAFKRLAGERLAYVNEWLQNMRIIRIMGWIERFEFKIKGKRIEETANRISMVTNGSTMNSIAQVAPLMINVVGVAALIKYRHEQVSPGDVFALLWIFGVFLARPIRNLPWTLVIFLDGYTSCKRLERFFKLQEEPHEGPAHTTGNRMMSTPGPGVSVKGLSLQLGGQYILKDIHFDVKPGEFVAIIGEVGAGKTQLLLALLKDSPAVFDHYKIGNADALKMTMTELRDHFTYVPQDGFTMSSSIRDNVAFTYDTSPSCDNDIIKSLGLADFDISHENLEGGLSTDIGERGVNLSGGQRQRVGLARAHYHDRNIVVLDDCLSAVDVDTEQKIIDRLLKGEWKNSTRILVTHRLSVLPFVDKVYVMEHGRLSERPSERLSEQTRSRDGAN